MRDQTNARLGTADAVWDLGPLYGAPEGADFEQDIRLCREMARRLAEEMAGQVAKLDASELCGVVKRLETIDTLLARLGTFAFLSFITRTDHGEASALLQRIEELEAVVGSLTVFFRLEWNQLSAHAAEILLGAPELDDFRHYLLTLRRYAAHQLSLPEEQLLKELQPVGRRAWNLLYDKVFGQLRFGPKGRTEEEVLEDLFSPDRKTRENGARELTRGLADNQHIFTHVFNTLAAEKMIEDRLRRYSSWQTSINLANELDEQCVATLVDAVCSRYDLVHRYYRLKRRLLGCTELYDYDRYAPIPGTAEKTVSWRQCQEIVLSAIGGFSPEMASIAQRFFGEPWIHAPLQAGKRGGAFAHPCVPEVHPYILVNYTGNVREVATVAHELGHGIHQVLAAERGFYNSEAPLVLAETASIFTELLVFKDQLRLMPTPAARCSLICRTLEEMFASVFRQIALFQFEAAFHAARRTSGELTAEKISQLWLDSQRPMFGDSLILRQEYGLWWACIPHFLSTPGYVYAYAFAELLVLSLYNRYRQEGGAFVVRYLQLLRAGGSDSPVRLLAPFGIELDDPGFWLSGFGYMEEMLSEAEQEFACMAEEGSQVSKKAGFGL